MVHSFSPSTTQVLTTENIHNNPTHDDMNIHFSGTSQNTANTPDFGSTTISKDGRMTVNYAASQATDGSGGSTSGHSTESVGASNDSSSTISVDDPMTTNTSYLESQATDGSSDQSTKSLGTTSFYDSQDNRISDMTPSQSETSNNEKTTEVTMQETKAGRKHQRVERAVRYKDACNAFDCFEGIFTTDVTVKIMEEYSNLKIRKGLKISYSIERDKDVQSLLGKFINYCTYTS